MQKVYYLAHFDLPDSTEQRSVSPATVTKVDYVSEAIVEIGYEVEIISPVQTKSTKYCKPSYKEISKNRFLKKFASLPYKGVLFRVLRRVSLFWQLLLYLFAHLHKEDVLIAYHSLPIMKIVSLAKRLKGFRLIQEVEEIYGDVIEDSKIVSKELRYFKLADGYIFPTILLDKKINQAKIPSVIIHGTYRVEPNYGDKFNDGKIHCVYAGTLDPRKGGGLTAVNVARYLDEKYHVHILGFGSKSEIAQLNEEIEKITSSSSCSISYDGCLSGEEYLRFLQRCDIGLSTQMPDAAFNATSFPSKILSYLSNGLRVVSVKIPAISLSDVGEYLYYYNDNKSSEIANTIKGIDFSLEYNSRQIISKLNISFQIEITKLLEQK